MVNNHTILYEWLQSIIDDNRPMHVLKYVFVEEDDYCFMLELEINGRLYYYDIPESFANFLTEEKDIDVEVRDPDMWFLPQTDSLCYQKMDGSFKIYNINCDGIMDLFCDIPHDVQVNLTAYIFRSEDQNFDEDQDFDYEECKDV